MAVEISRLHKGNKVINKVYQTSNRSLKQLTCGEQGKIVNVPPNSYLASLGFRMNKIVTIMAKGALNGPILCSIDGRNIALGQEVAQDIIVD
ncbi:FeoA family protein [Serpentinicella sp. ANB-PHB4]|uniref:FeoA family protein n=1 Tax=Serpentinicella sp. ANB-PHB4 TaxID=3074076 RepID=UPI00286138D7|nr:FeoA family protein [Serpentinicella sp. ANB-PHB4]MDR5658552.1 FeoA family protein [Serpentinicella sp. ANB-PHB4]